MHYLLLLDESWLCAIIIVLPQSFNLLWHKLRSINHVGKDKACSYIITNITFKLLAKSLDVE